MGVKPDDNYVVRCCRGNLRGGLFENVAHSAELYSAVTADSENPARWVGSARESVTHSIPNDSNGTASGNASSEFVARFERHVDEGRGRGRKITMNREGAINKAHGSR